jgi:hypothetical protein
MPWFAVLYAVRLNHALTDPFAPLKAVLAGMRITPVAVPSKLAPYPTAAYSVPNVTPLLALPLYSPPSSKTVVPELRMAQYATRPKLTWSICPIAVSHSSARAAVRARSKDMKMHLVTV